MATLGVTDADVEAFFSKLSQGMVIERSDSVSNVFSLFPPETTSIVIVSQTCDVVLPTRPSVILAPIVTLSGTLARQAASREMPRYVQVPLRGDYSFADLA